MTLLALPTLAILFLHATTGDVGVLIALQWLAFLFVGPLAGVVVDRLSRRAIMIVSDIGRLVALGTLPLFFAFGMLNLLYLYCVTAAVSILTVFFDVAYQSFLPDLVEPSAVVEGNTKLALGEASARVGGPALAGLLIQAVGAALAVVGDALSYLLSALLLTSIRSLSPQTTSPSTFRLKRVLLEILEGVILVMRHPLLRPIALANTGTNFGYAIIDAVILLFAYRELHLTAGIVGITLAVGNVGFIIGAALVKKVTRTLSVGITLNVTSLLGAAAPLLLPLGVLGVPALMLALWRFLFGFQLPIYNITSVSLRQVITPAYLQGRMNATMRTLSFGALGIGALLGGLLGSTFGLIPTIIVGSLLSILGSLALLERALRTLKEQPQQRET